MARLTQGLRFTASDRHIADEDHIELTSVGVDIGSATSHLVFSRLQLERVDTRYVVVDRAILYESDILLTPYVDDSTIDGDGLGSFIDRQYGAAGLARDEVDAGALILTGVALQRQNARGIADLFAREAGRLVAVSAGDRLEASLAAYGSGAAALSARTGKTVMNVDIGGGTTKIAICREGRVRDVAAADVGARLVVLDAAGRVARIEQAGRRIAQALGLDLAPGRPAGAGELRAMSVFMADALLALIARTPLSSAWGWLMRTPPLTFDGPVDALTFSGGVSEFLRGRAAGEFGDLGRLLAEEVAARVARLATPVEEATAGIRATVVGASQYTVQVSGNTIYLSSLDAVPIRNIPVVTPELALGAEEIDSAAVRRAVSHVLSRFDAPPLPETVAIAIPWQGSATYSRIHSVCRGITEAAADTLGEGKSLVFVSDADVGGLLGMHLKEEMGFGAPVISIDGIELREFDYIDIGALIPATGAVPVVIKSLVFP